MSSSSEDEEVVTPPRRSRPSSRPRQPSSSSSTVTVQPRRTTPTTPGRTGGGDADDAAHEDRHLPSGGQSGHSPPLGGGYNPPPPYGPRPPPPPPPGYQQQQQQQRQHQRQSAVSPAHRVPNWMPFPPGHHHLRCPPGLEYLAQIDHLLVRQSIELFEVLTGWETENRYRIMNTSGQDVYLAAEESGPMTRQCFGHVRPFDMQIVDNFGREVMHFYRPFRSGSCCCSNFLQVLEVTAPVGEVIGYVAEEWDPCLAKYTIEDADHEPVLRISGPWCIVDCCCDIEFRVLSADGRHQVGEIRKQWSGLVRELFTDADNFGITFPNDLDVETKAVMLAACFLIDFMYFEKRDS